jgi:hypothetical protein
MDQVDKQKNTPNNEPWTLKEVIAVTKSGTKYLGTKWLTILVFSIIGGLLMLGYAVFRNPKYTAVYTFVLDDTKDELGQFSDLEALTGLGLGQNQGMFDGDNILSLYTSRRMIGDALLSRANFNGKTMLLIDRYAASHKLRKRWKSHDDIDDITFDGDPEKFSRKQDSLITDLARQFNKKFLSVTKPDKKLAIIRVSFESTDELFAKEFTDKLVDNVNSFYIETKTKKTYQNVMLLQKQADSVKLVLNTSLSGVASAMDATPNANPLLLSLKVSSEKKQVDVEAATAIYGEVVKNLEIAKISLRQETPLIQVIDKPILPLSVDKIKKITGFIVGFLVAMFLTGITLILIKIYNKLIA